jgi:type I restriction enzyme S subunit
MKTRLISSEITRRPLGEIATIQRDAIAPTQIRSGTIYVGLENVTSSGEFTNVSAVSAGDLASTKFYFSRQHILYGKLRPYLSKIARPDFDGVCSTDILPILPSSAVDKNYLFHYLRTPVMVDQATTRSIGANLPRLSPQQLAEFEIPLPPLAEQKRIADILDKADGIRRKRREAVESVNTFSHSLFAEMFDGGIKSCHANAPPPDWRSLTVNDVRSSADYSCVGGPFGSDLTSTDYILPPGVPVVRGCNLSHSRVYMLEDEFVFVSEAKADELFRCLAVPGDLIISQRGARLAGQVGVVSPNSTYKRFVVSQSQMKLSPNNDLVDVIFLVHYFQSKWAIREMENRMISTGVPHINLGILKEFPLYLPPRHMQRHFSECCNKYQQGVYFSPLAKNGADQLFDSLIHTLFFKGQQ